MVDIAVSGAAEQFVATGEVVKFDGFLRLYSESVEDETGEGEEALLPPMKKGDEPTAQTITALQRFTQSPPVTARLHWSNGSRSSVSGRPSILCTDHFDDHYARIRD